MLNELKTEKRILSPKNNILLKKITSEVQNKITKKKLNPSSKQIKCLSQNVNKLFLSRKTH